MKIKSNLRGNKKEKLSESSNNNSGFSKIEEEKLQPKSGKKVSTKNVKIKEKTKNQSENKISMVDFYAEKILNKATRGSLDIQGSQFEISYSKILSETHKKRVIYIYEYPTKVYPGHLEALRILLKNSVAKEDKGSVGINICEHSFPYNVSFSSKKIINQEKVFRRTLKMVQSNIDEIKNNINDSNPAVSRRKGRDDLTSEEKKYSRVLRKVKSFDYMNSHQRVGGSLCKTFVFVEVIAETSDLVDTATEKVIELLNQDMYRFREITELESYMKDFCIASLKAQVKPDTDVNPMTLTTDISSMTSTYSQGIVRSKNGDVYLGHSLETKYPIHFSMSESADSVTILVVADTGGGKTHFCKILSAFSLNHRNNTYNAIVNDYKGGEWELLVPIMGGKGAYVSMGIENPKCINMLPIPDYKIFKFTSKKSAFQLSYSSSVKLLTTQVGGLTENNTRKIEAVCTDIINKVYSDANVDKDYPETYKNSEGLTYLGSLWKAIEYITNEDKDMITRHGIETLQTVKIGLEPYFAPTGNKTYMYENAVPITDMLDKKFIVFDYGSQSTSGSAMFQENEVQARFFQKNYFTTLYTAYKKLIGEYTIEFIEEVQRYLTNPILARDLNHMVTGGRSSNKINIMLTNTITSILQSKDLDQSAIKENINTVIMGRCKESVAKEVCEYFGLDTSWNKMKSVAKNSKEEGYAYSFLYAFNTGETFDIEVGRVVAPPSIMNAKFMESRKIETVSNEDEEDYELNSKYLA